MMRLTELFSSGVEIRDRLRNAALDMITPLLAQEVPFVTIQQVINTLRQLRTGIFVDRSLVLSILDPQTVQAVKAIEGDKIYLERPDADPSAETSDVPDADPQKISDTAVKQARKEIDGK